MILFFVAIIQLLYLLHIFCVNACVVIDDLLALGDRLFGLLQM